MIMTYRYYEKKYTVHRRPCIDGKFTGSNKCTAYCKCALHPGFLTKDLEISHECARKQCNHYIPKVKEEPLMTMKYIVQAALLNC